MPNISFIRFTLSIHIKYLHQVLLQLNHLTYIVVRFLLQYTIKCINIFFIISVYKLDSMSIDCFCIEKNYIMYSAILLFV